MSEKFTPPPPVEQSLKYLAWSIKEMNENVKRIADCLERFIVQSSSKKTQSYKNDQEIPF